MKAFLIECAALAVVVILIAVFGATLMLGFNALFGTNIPPWAGATFAVGMLISVILDANDRKKKKAEAK